MQPRIDGPFDPTKADATKEKKAEESKTNPVLFDQVKQWVSTNARAELLMKALGFLEILDSQTGQTDQEKRAKVMEKLEGDLLPPDNMAKKAQAAVNVAKQLLPQAQEFEKALVKGDAKQSLAWLTDVSKQLNNPKNPLPQKTQKAVQESYKPVFQSKNGAGQSLNALLFQADLGRTVIAAQADWGVGAPMVLASMMDKLKQMANATPPTPFSDMAKQMLADLENDAGKAALKTLLENPQKNVDETEAAIVKLLQQMSGDKEVQKASHQATAVLTGALGPKGLYDAYLQQIEAQAASVATLEGTEKNIKAQKQFFMKAIETLKKAAPGNPAVAKALSQLIALKFPPENDKETGELNDFTKEFFATYSSLVHSKTLSPVAQRDFLEQVKEYFDTTIKTNEAVSHQQIDALSTLKSHRDNVESLTPSLNAIESCLTSLESGQKLSSSQQQELTGAIADLHTQYPTLSSQEQRQIDTLTTELTKLSADNTLSPQKALYQAAVLRDSLDEKRDALTAEIGGKTQAKQALEAQNKVLASAKADAHNKKLMAPSSNDEPPLPWQFAQVIFDNVIPGQDSQLMAAGNLLSLYNQFSSGCNNTLTDLTGWDSASFDISGWLSAHEGSPAGTYNISPQTALNQFDNAQGQLVASFQQLQAAVKDLQSQIQQIKNSPPPLSTVQTNRLKELTTDMSNLIGPNTDPSTVTSVTFSTPLPSPLFWNGGPSPIPTGGPGSALSNLSQLSTDYCNAQTMAHWEVGDNNTYFTDSYKGMASIASACSTDEPNLVNGATGAPQSGMKSIYQAISAEQSNYSGFSQQQQMTLQLTMTQTQQMFSTITSAMQDLNQSYSSIAQAISK